MNVGKLRIVLIILLGVGLVGMGMVYLLREPIKATVKGVRAERIITRAEAAFAAEEWVEAARLGQAAHYLAPENKDLQLLVARALLKSRNASTVAWWRRILEEPDLPVDELRMVTAALLVREDPSEALPFLNRLLELDGESPETRRLWMQSLQQQRRYGMAMNLAGQMAEGGSEDWEIHRSYLRMQGALDEAGADRVLEHLENLMDEGGPLALNAARELLVASEAGPPLREKAARFLKEQAEDDLDRLYALSFEVKEGSLKQDDLMPILRNILDDPESGLVPTLTGWARWMNAEEWFLENVSWELYRESGGSPDPYLNLLYTQGSSDRILALTETTGAEAADDVPVLLYYRSLVLDQTGDTDRARQTLQRAVQTVDPGSANTLERYLIRGGNWGLLTDLYGLMLRENPQNAVVLLKLLGAHYYQGNQDALIPLLNRIEIGEFQNQPDAEGFASYLRLMLNGYSPEVHKHVESLMSAYPEVFDFRLILGLSYVLQGKMELARSLAQNMPELGMNAPRHFRVIVTVLGIPTEAELAPAEREFLLPRERFLLSRSGAGSAF